jgi:hypothetical protein
MMQQLINWWCDLSGICDPAIVQTISKLLGGAGGIMIAYLAFAAALSLCGLLINALLRPMI